MMPCAKPELVRRQKPTPCAGWRGSSRAYDHHRFDWRNRHERLSARGWPDNQIQQRIAAQLPIQEKISRSDFVLWNEASLELLSEQIDLVFRALQVSN